MVDDCAEALRVAEKAVHGVEMITLKHDTHEQTCARRYEDWHRSTDELKTAIRGLYGMLWAASGSALMTLVVGVGTLVFFLITKK